MLGAKMKEEKKKWIWARRDLNLLADELLDLLTFVRVFRQSRNVGEYELSGGCFASQSIARG